MRARGVNEGKWRARGKGESVRAPPWNVDEKEMKNSVSSENVMDTADSFFTNSRYHQKK